MKALLFLAGTPLIIGVVVGIVVLLLILFIASGYVKAAPDTAIMVTLSLIHAI